MPKLDLFFGGLVSNGLKLFKQLWMNQLQPFHDSALHDQVSSCPGLLPFRAVTLNNNDLKNENKLYYLWRSMFK